MGQPALRYRQVRVGNRSARIAALSLAALLGLSGCRSSPDAEKLFAEAEGLQQTYEKDARERAITKYREATTAWTRRGNRSRAARAAQRVGATYWQLGLLHEALQAYRAALSLARESADHALESEIHSDVGTAQAFVADRQDAYKDAGKHCEAALELARQSGADRAMAKALSCFGEVAYFGDQHLERALEFYRKAERVWDGLGDRRGQAETLLLQGYVYSDLSRFEDARACYDRARSLWVVLGDRREQAITLVADARLHVRRGEYQEALNTFGEAQARLQRMGDAVWEGSALTGIARVYLDMARTGSALKSWERAFEIFETAGLKTTCVDLLMSLGETYLSSGDDATALKRFERALVLAEELGNQRWQAKALRYIGLVYLFRRSPSQADQYLKRSLDAQRAPGSPVDPRLQARTRADMGEAHDLLGEHDVAVKHFEDALALSRVAGDRVTEARGLFGLARTAVGVNDLDAARKHVERALTVAESLRTEVESRDLRASYLASVYRWHELHMDVLMRLHRVHPRQGLAAAAFEASERARARSLLDSLADADVDLRAGVDADLLKREQMSRRAFDDWAGRQRRVSTVQARAAEARALAEEYRDLEERYTQIQAEIRSKSPRYAALAQPQPLSLKQLRQQVLDAETLLLEYALGDERSYLWAVSSRNHASYELPPRAAIEQAAQRVYERLTARLTATGDQRDRSRRIEQADAEYWQEAKRLSEMLLGPVAKKMAGKRILVVTDGALQYLPFAALPVPGGRDEPVPMVVEHEIISLPSASVLAMLRRETQRRTPPDRAVAVLADPVFEADDPRLRTGTVAAAPRNRGLLRDDGASVSRLASTRLEADAIVAAAPAGMTLKAIDFDASRATAMSPELAQYRIVHFATHGVFDNENPGLSGVVLSMFDKQGQPQDGFLRLHDIYGLNLPAELVVLSACNTALGKPVRGEGLVGIVRGFMYAGAHSWPCGGRTGGARLSTGLRSCCRESGNEGNVA